MFAERLREGKEGVDKGTEVTDTKSETQRKEGLAVSELAIPTKETEGRRSPVWACLQAAGLGHLGPSKDFRGH